MKGRTARAWRRIGADRRTRGPNAGADIATPGFGFKSHGGIDRARTRIGLANIAYTVRRFVFLENREGAVPV